MLDAFEPLQVHNTEHGQWQADPEEYQTHIEPPTGEKKKLKQVFKTLGFMVCSVQIIYRKYNFFFFKKPLITEYWKRVAVE